MVYNLAVVTTWFGILGLSWGLLEPIPFPVDIQNCYDYRSYNQTPSPDAAMQIQIMCYRNYQYEQMAAGNVWTGKNLTDEGVSYINSLFRRLLIEADEAEKYHRNGGRQRRQTTPRRFRQEVRSTGGFDPFARCIQRLQNEVRNGRILQEVTFAKLSLSLIVSLIKIMRMKMCLHLELHYC